MLARNIGCWGPTEPLWGPHTKRNKGTSLAKLGVRARNSATHSRNAQVTHLQPSIG